METNHCPTCHAPIPANAPGGFCPACLLRDADETPVQGPAAPSVEVIAAAFPQWEVIELIGQGGMGYVYKVRQPSLDRVVALKILSPELSRDPAFAERFAREARTLGNLHHPNIVTVFEHGESGGFFYLLMEYVDGVNLRQALRAGRFTPQQALSIVPGICDALQYAHENGVWHRDIKPENILLDRDGKVKIADFGIARIVGDPQRDFTLTMTGNALGSAAYMAPEQHEKPHEVDHRADIYSLGVVIYEMLTGELPLGRFPSPSRKAAVDARIDEIVLRTLEKERELRQQSATEVKTDVVRAMQPGAASSRADVTSNPAGGSSIMAKLALALMLAAAFGFVFLLIFEVKFIINLMSCAAILALCFILAVFSWRTSLGKSMAILSALVLLLGGGRLALLKLDDMSTSRPSYMKRVVTSSEFFGMKPRFIREPSGEVSSTIPAETSQAETAPRVSDPSTRMPRPRMTPPEPPPAGREQLRKSAPTPGPKYAPLPPLHPEPKIDIPVDWKLTLPGGGEKPEKVIALKGKLEAYKTTYGNDHRVEVIHVETDTPDPLVPVCLLISPETWGPDPWEPRGDGRKLERTVYLDGAEFKYSISEVDQITINSEIIDLRKGRVFMLAPDGTLRQLPLFPERLPEKLSEFADALPAEMFQAGGAQALKLIPMVATENLRSISTFLDQPINIPVDWKMTLPAEGYSPEKTIQLQGRLEAGYFTSHHFTAVVIHSQPSVPICMLISPGKLSVNPLERRSDAGKLERTATFNGRDFLFSISEVDKITINSETLDLSKGRVILCAPDGTLRQVPRFPHQTILVKLDELGRMISREIPK